MTTHEKRMQEIESMQDELFPLSTKATREYVRDRAIKAIAVFTGGTISLDNDAVMMLISQLCYEAGSSFLGKRILSEYLNN